MIEYKNGNLLEADVDALVYLPSGAPAAGQM